MYRTCKLWCDGSKMTFFRYCDFLNFNCARYVMQVNKTQSNRNQIHWRHIFIFTAFRTRVGTSVRKIFSLRARVAPAPYLPITQF